MSLRQLDEEKSHVCELEQEVVLCEEEVRKCALTCTCTHGRTRMHSLCVACGTVVSLHRLLSGQVTVASSLYHCS